MICGSYTTFKSKVRKNADGLCEISTGCDDPGETVHHFFKRSTHPSLVLETRNGMWICGRHHEQVEEMQRQGEDVERLYPDRYHEFAEEVRTKTDL